MAATEAQRMRVRQGFQKVMEADLADTIMEMLPREGWDDVVRRRDLEPIAQELGFIRERLRGLTAGVWALGAIICSTQVALFTVVATRV